jgi:UDP-N-acetylmuramate dehydrogenase
MYARSEHTYMTPPASSLPPPALRGELRHGEPMSRHVSWRAGGIAERAYFPADLEDLQVFLRTLPFDESVQFIGLGSNLLVRDGGLKGTVVFTHWALRDLALVNSDQSGSLITASAGVASPKVARFAALHGLIAAEFLAGIPGTLGGALAMNAGCYGGETWHIVRSVTTIDRHGQVHQRTPADYRVGYRTVQRLGAESTMRAPASGLAAATTQEWFVSAVLAFPRGDGAQARQKIKELLAKRIASQPLGEPNAGSVFRNPPGTYAARLIEDCGLKGRTIGGALISPKHANFIVNTGNASAADIEALIELAQSSVKEKFGLDLEREVRIIGEPK